MYRREFLAVAIAAGAAGKAQALAKPWRIGSMTDAPPDPRSENVLAFLAGMHDLGYELGRDYVIERAYDQNRPERAPAAAAELVSRRVDLILTSSTTRSLAAKGATATIPIVMVIVNDAVASGLVASLAHPGGNVTGLTVMSHDLNAKRAQLLHEVVPAMRSLGMLWNPDYPGHAAASIELEQVVRQIGVELRRVSLRSADELDTAIERIAQQHTDALLMVDQPLIYAAPLRDRLLAALARMRLPTLGPNRDHAHAGALLSYGVDFAERNRRSATYVVKILGQGIKPAELPVEQPTQFSLVVNLKVARAIGVTIPTSMRLQADEVIE